MRAPSARQSVMGAVSADSMCPEPGPHGRLRSKTGCAQNPGRGEEPLRETNLRLEGAALPGGWQPQEGSLDRKPGYRGPCCPRSCPVTCTPGGARCRRLPPGPPPARWDTYFLRASVTRGKPVTGWSQTRGPGRCAAFLRVGLGAGGQDSEAAPTTHFSRSGPLGLHPERAGSRDKEQTVHRVHRTETRPHLELPASPPDGQMGGWERGLTHRRHRQGFGGGSVELN